MKFSALCIAFLLSTMPAQEKPSAVVDRIEDNNIAVIEVCHNGHLYMGEVPANYINGTVHDGSEIDVKAITGAFSNKIYALDGKPYYQFKSYNNKDWWFLSESELGFAPKADKPYTLFASENATYSCADNEGCECYVYDDFFICIKE